MPSHLEIPVGLLDCPISQQAIDDPVIAPEGQSFGSGIHTWVNDVRRTNPITRTALEAHQLRSNLWLKNLLQNYPIPANATSIRIPCEILNNPTTGRPFINPVVNEQGVTVEGTAGAPYSNLLLKHLCEKKAQLEAAESAQPPATPVSETAPLLPPTRLPVVATTQAVSVTAPGRNHSLQVLLGNNANSISINNLRERLEEVWRVYDRRISNVERRTEYAVDASRLAINTAEDAAADARSSQRDAHQALSVAARALEQAKQNKGYTIGVGATLAALLATVGIIIFALRHKIFSDNNNHTSQPTANPTSPPAPTPSQVPTPPPTICIQPRYTVSYSFSVPYVPGGNLCVNNNGNRDISLKGLTFTSNALLNGNPWNGLFPWQSTISSTPNGLLNDYSIAMSSNVVIPASSSVCLTYNYNQSANAPMEQAVGMNPTTVGITYADGSTATLPMQGTNPCALTPVSNYGLTAWYPNWGMYDTGRNYTVADLPVQKITQVNYAFFGVNTTTAKLTTLDVYADSNQLPALAMLKPQYPYLETYAAVGGYCSGSQFNTLTANQNLIDIFATDAANKIDVFQMDGIYIDWEWDPSCSPNPDPNGFTQLFSTLRTTLDNRFGPGKKFIGINVPAGIDKITMLPNATWCAVQSKVNKWDVMTYDYGGAFSAKMNYGSPLDIDPRDPMSNDSVLKYYNVKSSIQIYRDMGCIPDNKIGVGVPAYGRSAFVSNVTAPLNGLWQTVMGTPKGQYDTSNQTGTFDYRCIAFNTVADCHNFTQPPVNLNLIPTDQNVYGNVTMQPWAYAQANFTLTFDDTTAAQAKAQFVMEEGFNNVFVWDASQDAPSGSGKSLIDTVYDTLNTPQVSAAKHSGLNAAGTTPAAQIKRSVVLENPAQTVATSHPTAIPPVNSANTTQTTQNQTSLIPNDNDATRLQNFVQGKIQAFMQLLPESVRNSALTTASNTAIFALLPQALQTAMTYQLNKAGCKKVNILCANIGLQLCFSLYALYSSPAGTASAFATSRFVSYLMNYCGFSKEISETLATSAAAIAAISVNAATTQLEAVKNALKVTLLMVTAFSCAFEGAKFVLSKSGVSDSVTNNVANIVAGTAGAVTAAIISPLTPATTAAVLAGSYVGKKAGEKIAQFGIWNNMYIPTDPNYRGILSQCGPRISTAALMRSVNNSMVALETREKMSIVTTHDKIKQMEEGAFAADDKSAISATGMNTWSALRR